MERNAEMGNIARISMPRLAPGVPGVPHTPQEWAASAKPWIPPSTATCLWQIWRFLLGLDQPGRARRTPRVLYVAIADPDASLLIDPLRRQDESGNPPLGTRHTPTLTLGVALLVSTPTRTAGASGDPQSRGARGGLP